MAGRRSLCDRARRPGKATLGEGPIWDSRDGRLLWVDIVEGAINVLTPSTSAIRRIEVGENVGCIALTARPDTVVGALRSGWYWIDVETGAKQLIAASPAGKIAGSTTARSIAPGASGSARWKTARRIPSASSIFWMPICPIDRWIEDFSVRTALRGRPTDVGCSSSTPEATRSTDIDLTTRSGRSAIAICSSTRAIRGRSGRHRDGQRRHLVVRFLGRCAGRRF